MTPEAPADRPQAETIPALLAERRRVDAGRRALVTADEAVTYAQLDDASTALAARLVAAGVVKGDRVGLLAPNGIAWASRGAGRRADRRGPRPAQHPPAAARAARPAHDGHGHPPDRRSRAPEPALPRRPGDRRAGAGGSRPLRCPPPRRPGAAPAVAHRRPAHTCVGARPGPGDGGPGAARRRPRRAVHLRQPGGAQGRDPHPRRRPAGDGGRTRGPVRGARRAALHPHAVLLDRRLLQRAADRPGRRGDAAHRGRARTGPHPRPAPARAGDPVPGVARPGGPPRRPPRLRRRRPLVAGRREPRRRAAGRAAPGPGGTGQRVRDDRVVRPLLRRPARHRHAAGQVRELRPAVRRSRGAGGRSRDRRGAAPGRAGRAVVAGPQPPARHLRPGPLVGVHRGRVLPHRRPRAPRRGRLPLVRRPARRHVQGQGRNRLPLRGGGGAAGGRRGARRPRHRRGRRRRPPGRRPGGDRPAGRGGRRGRGVDASDALDAIDTAVRERLSAFKAPTRWLLTSDPGAVPLSATGKVDKPALQRLLREQGRPAQTKERTA